ncbi:glycosyltransferase family 2 protein [Candidatus Woesearchaeota archaeon]|jgi:UDP-N-acetylglucosamine---dolichyl-phosphate N-acetylglucosaminyltransferase|nr:glycosyltransferase family 2 protein [Candidatus Woesearchaeota archaeon]
MNKHTWVVIPAYNEEKKIGAVINKVKKICKNIVVVDDGSKDNTYELAKSKKVTALKHIINLGKGSAAKTGCDYVFKQNGQVMILIDADGQHKPEDIPRFLTQINKGNDIVFGYRSRTKKMPAVFRFGNWFINKVTEILYEIKIKDSQSGYRAFTSESYTKIRWNSTDYSMESEMIANVGKNKLKYSEIPIATIYSDDYKGTTIFDGIKIVWNMLIWRLEK